jgi:two-component system, OmpR family, response regulator
MVHWLSDTSINEASVIPYNTTLTCILRRTSPSGQAINGGACVETSMSAEQPPEQPLRILLVEDDNHIGRIIELALPDIGVPFEFVSVLSAEEGLELWLQRPFGLLLTDYNLRGMTGLKLIETLKEQGLSAPTVLVTAYDTAEVRKEARALAVDAYLIKPFFMDELVKTVRSLLPATAREVNGA